MPVDKYQNARIYAQLKPDQASLTHLQSLQQALSEQVKGRIISRDRLHMTLIHFGKVHDVYNTIKKITNLSYDKYSYLLTAYIKDTEAQVPKHKFLAEPVGFARFGEGGGTLVVEYIVPDELIEFHKELYYILRKFLIACGINNTDAFLATDQNFMHAGILRPHITLCKGYKGELPEADLKPVTLLPITTVYSDP